MPSTFGQIRANDLLNDVFSGYDPTGGVTVAGSPITVGIANEHTVSSPRFSLSNGEVTVNVTDTYEIVYSASVLGGGRAQAQAWLELNSVEIPGTRSALYARMANHGATGTAQIFFALSVGDTIRIRVQRTAGSSNAVRTLANGSRLALKRL